MKKLLPIVLLFSLAACQQESAHDANSSGEAQTRTTAKPEACSLGTGLTHFRFSEWAGPELPVWVYVPGDIDMKTAPIMVMMHGAKRGAARYLAEWDDVAEANGFIVVAPEFSAEQFPKSAKYNLGNRLQDDGETQNDEAVWTFSAIEPIFDRVVTDACSDQQTYTLYGHSAGSQFIHRFMYFKPDARVRRFLPANAGWYTMPDLETPYPYGLGGTGIAEVQLKRVLEKDVVILLGDQDTDANHSSLRRTTEAMAQGEHRFARGRMFYEVAKANADKFGADFGWRIRTVEGVAHSNGGIAAASGDLVE